MSTNDEHSAVARLGAKGLLQTKDGLRKVRKKPAVLDFNTQHHELALEGTQRQDSAKPPHREWNGPPSNREGDSHAGTRPKQRYDRWDGPRGRQRHWKPTCEASQQRFPEQRVETHVGNETKATACLSNKSK